MPDPYFTIRGETREENHGSGAGTHRTSRWTVTSSSIEGQIRVETEKDDRDKYGRLLLNLYRDDGVLINKVLIQQGVAIQMAVAPNIRYISV